MTTTTEAAPKRTTAAPKTSVTAPKTSVAAPKTTTTTTTTETLTTTGTTSSSEVGGVEDDDDAKLQLPETDLMAAAAAAVDLAHTANLANKPAPVDLSDYESILCACFENDCNGLDNVIPKKEDLDGVRINWKYVEEDF